MKKSVLALITIITTYANASGSEINVLHDEARKRSIPIEIKQPTNAAFCTKDNQCPVAFISAGYGESHQNYQFLSDTLAHQGYLSVSIRHELKTDPPLSVTGNLYQTRQENWQRGAKTLDFVRSTLATDYPQYDFDNLLLVGHSNGGDISALLINQGKTYVSGLVTFDHRRVPLPRNKTVSVLSIRGSDFPADKGVLYTEKELQTYPGCVIKIPNSKHNDMTDEGPMWLKKSMSALFKGHLNGQSCQRLQSKITEK
ncbi:alpha/beta hydrolase [Pseudoalteromonas luteoviolacea]|uniref:alpha/beta hydrolase n=1 Tax=Pseudoalteromonas luteoviolacea TaxID=43657 RepID=UPI0031BB4CEF|nr:alpha/beta hydrolase [Pseudoalteromonas luteoviolacea]